MNRETMLQKLRDEASTWFVSECNLYGGWRVIKDFDTHEFVVCHTTHDPITRQDWESATHWEHDNGFHLESFERIETGREMAERFNREVLGSVRPIHPNVVKFSEWMIKELNRVKR